MYTKIQRFKKGIEEDCRHKEVNGARWRLGWGISPSKTHTDKFVVLGKPKRLEARTA
jgi:hypothetical protein